LLSYPRSAIRFLADGNAGRISAAPLWSFICPSVSNRTSGRPLPSQTACSLEFSPPLVRPMQPGAPPFAVGSPPCGAPSDASYLSSADPVRLPGLPRPRRCARKRRAGSSEQSDYTTSCAAHSRMVSKGAEFSLKVGAEYSAVRRMV
jgi:hypothetical protein